MQEINFIEYLTKTGHTKKSIVSRISRLNQIEIKFNLDIDTIIFDKEKVVNLLINLKDLDTPNQNLSNALRHYYTCMTNEKIEKNISEYKK